jgi:hypothetical protein
MVMARKPISYRAQSELRDIEELLCVPPFRGVPMGHTLATYLHLSLMHGTAETWDARTAALSFVRAWRHWAFPLRLKGVMGGSWLRG